MRAPKGEVSLFGKPEHEDLKPRIANIPKPQESSRLEYKIVARFEKPFTQMAKNPSHPLTLDDSSVRRKSNPLL